MSRPGPSMAVRHYEDESHAEDVVQTLKISMFKDGSVRAETDPPMEDELPLVEFLRDILYRRKTGVVIGFIVEPAEA